MNYPAAFRAAIAAVLVLAIGWKIAIPHDIRGSMKQDLVDFLERNHFEVVATDEMMNDTLVIRATAASCRLQLAKLAPDGSNATLIRHLAAGAERSFVVFRGAVYAQQPVFRTVLDYAWSRILRELGLVSYIPPVISVAQNAACNAERLQWGELQGRV